ncbi:MAG: type II secretion system F family protein, partial [Actinomycetota bacterium]|nr:type II secretion system F family protein [Actinomycetota bacterium]
AALAVLLPLSVVAALGLLSATVLGRRRAARARRLRGEQAAALREALEVLVGELKVGAHPAAAVRSAAAESTGPVARSLTAVAARAVLGADVAAGLRAEGRRSRAAGHWERLAVCWELAHQHGLAIATLMQTAQHDIAERERFAHRVDASMAGPRTTAAILAGLPVLGLALGHALGADPVGFLLSGSTGGWLLVTGTALLCAGLLWSDAILARALT